MGRHIARNGRIMRVSRLYLKQPLSAGLSLSLDNDNAHYVRNVLRLKKAAKVAVFNGQGGEWSARVAEIHKKRVVIDIDVWQERDVESALSVHLGLAIARSDRMDWAVQKAVELGVNAITPLITERCVVQLKADKIQQKQGHWQRIVQNATEQCGRTVLPDTHAICDLATWLAEQSGLKLFCDPYADKSLPQLEPGSGSVTLLSGPEGGFSEAEREQAKQAGFIPIRLGKRILRSETAALAALAATQTLWGDFK